MRIVFLVLVLVHALIHVLGFVKAFGFKEVKELSLFISKPFGLLWLLTALLFLLYAILYLSGSKWGWILGLSAVLLSQLLIIVFWKDAKFATIPNLIILFVALMAMGSFFFTEIARKERKKIIEQSSFSNDQSLSGEDLRSLPAPVQRWLRTCGIVGKPPITLARVEQEAKMKLREDQEDWMEATALQFTTIDRPAFIWTTDVKMNDLLSFKGRDKFEEGRGEMLIKLNSLIKIVDAKGEKIDQGALQRFLGEMVWFPSMAMSPYISWEELDDLSAKASMEHQGTSGSGTFYFNEEGDFIRFTALRYKGGDEEAKKHEWVLDVEEYSDFEGIRIPSKMTASWMLESGKWTWLDLEIKDIVYNENALK